MGEFFKGWRRKAGCVTLMMACVLLFGWARSTGQCDEIFWTFNQSRHDVDSLDNCICINRQTPAPDPSFMQSGWVSAKLSEVGGYRPEDRNNEGTFPRFDPMKRYDNSMSKIRWRWDWIGFHAGVADNDDRAVISRIETYMIPYWSIVVPLTLLSAYLLLSKPRPTKPKN